LLHRIFDGQNPRHGLKDNTEREGDQAEGWALRYHLEEELLGMDRVEEEN
jgi:hypothetical protein